MLNYLWSAMILLGILWGAVNGRLDEVTMGMLDGAKDGVSLCLTMLGMMSFWSGILEIGNQAGLIEWLSQKMRPVIRFLFPRLDPKAPAAKHICVNMIANMLGLGMAATPAGLQAMKELQKKEEQKTGQKTGIASREMCVFLIINVSSLQLIPVNIIAYRSQYASANPSAIVGPALAATLISTAAGILFCKLMDSR